MNNQSCGYYLPVEGMNYHPGGTAFRIETASPAGRCQLKPKKDNVGRTHNVVRWIMSGGSAMTVADPCSAKCPLRVPVETGNLGRSWSAYCPSCHTSNTVKSIGLIRCRDCGQGFEAYADWMIGRDRG
jgi:hypothetical protein